LDVGEIESGIAEIEVGRKVVNGDVTEPIYKEVGSYKPVPGQIMEPTYHNVKSSADDIVRVRHHTSLNGLKGIKNSNSIHASRIGPYGVDVEVSPFLNPTNANLGQFGRGSFIEFSVPKSQLISPLGYMGETGNAGRIVTGGKPLDLSGTSPKFVRWNWLGL